MHSISSGGKPLLRPGEQYRKTTLGKALQNSLDELIKDGKINQNLANKILSHFDVHMNGKLNRVAPEFSYKAEELIEYREVKSVYTFTLKRVLISGRGMGHQDTFQAHVPKLRIEAHPSIKLTKHKLAKKAGAISSGARKAKNNQPFSDEEENDEDF